MNQEEELRGCRQCKDILSDTDDLPFTENKYLVLHVLASLINSPPPPPTPPHRPGNQKSKEEKDREKKEKKEREKKEKKERKDKRDTFCWTLKSLVSALRNSGGGVVLVHIVGLNTNDNCLHHFHELVDPRLNEMIENGNLFINIYRKNWIKSILQEEETPVCNNYSDIVAVVVLPTNNVVTVDFNTKVPQDFSIVDPACEEIVKYLKIERKFRSNVPHLRGLNVLQESRKIQHKSFVIEDEELERSIRENPVSFADYIWNNSKLGYSISAFSKVEGGGSFYLGIAEDNETSPSYVTKKHLLKGFKFERRRLDDLTTALRRQIKNHTVVLFFGSNSAPSALPPQYVDIEFYVISSGLYVCEVAIAAVNGLVFHTKTGPEAYDLDADNKLNLIDILDWKERLLRKDPDVEQYL